jgi:hypothetical protein
VRTISTSCIRTRGKPSTLFADQIFSDPPNSSCELCLNGRNHCCCYKKRVWVGIRKLIVTFRTGIQTPASFTHLLAQKPSQAPVYPVCPESVQHWNLNWKSVATKLYVKTGRMSNQQKAEFVVNIFCIQSVWGSHGEVSPKTWFIQEGAICSEMLIQQLVEFPTAVTQKSLTVWSRLMDHRKYERVIYQNSIQDFRSFSQFENWNWRSVLPLFCPEIEFSSDIDHQNSVTSKPFYGHSHMCND